VKFCNFCYFPSVDPAHEEHDVHTFTHFYTGDQPDSFLL
jgi:hypothetical protein